MKKTVITICAALAGLATAPASAAPITYELSGLFDATVGGTSFNNQAVTITAIADTDDLAYSAGQYVLPVASLFASAAGFGTNPISGSFHLFFDPGASLAGIADAGSTLVAVGSGPLAGYNGVSAFGPVSVSFDHGDTVSTAYGQVHVTDASDLMFTASVAPVPEPATWAMMIGGFGFAGTAMRRRSAKLRFA